jgi:hypothetical protein
VPIWSTAGADDGSDTARVIRDAVRKCQHDRSQMAAFSPDPEAAARLAGGKLAEIAGLTEAAEALLAENRATQEAQEAVEEGLRRLAEDESADIGDLDERASELERQASGEDGRAYAAAARAGAHDPWPPREGARELLGLARGTLKETVGLVAGAVGSESETRLAARLARLQTRLSRLSSALDQAE